METRASTPIWPQPSGGRLVAVASGFGGYPDESPCGVGFESFGRGLDAALRTRPGPRATAISDDLAWVDGKLGGGPSRPATMSPFGLQHPAPGARRDGPPLPATPVGKSACVGCVRPGAWRCRCRSAGRRPRSSPRISTSCPAAALPVGASPPRRCTSTTATSATSSWSGMIQICGWRTSLARSWASGPRQGGRRSVGTCGRRARRSPSRG
jgi:hypothetical protein